jgi:hypothetical protein
MDDVQNCERYEHNIATDLWISCNTFNCAPTFAKTVSVFLRNYVFTAVTMKGADFGNALVKTEVSVKGITSIIRTTRIGELVTAVTSNKSRLPRNSMQLLMLFLSC